MGSVYRARDIELDEWVAIKLLRPELLSHSDTLARFRQEVKLARRVTHPHVARVYDLGEDAGRRFLTMEFIDGESLAARLRRVGPLGVPSTLMIARDILQGLAAVHAAGVVHRDLKPENVLVTPEARVVITDFGVARTLRSEDGLAQTGGLVLGTPEYMAPEQVEGQEEVDARADLYALGAMLFELLTGKRAWGGPTPLASMVARLLHPPPDPRTLRPDLPAPVAELVVRLLARDRTLRPTSALETVRLIEALVLHEPGAVPLAPPTAASSQRGREVRLAVLPVQHLLGPEDEHLSGGLTHELIDALAGAPGLRVVPQTEPAFDARTDRLASARAVGRALNVHVLVDASLAADLPRTPSAEGPPGCRLTVRLLSTDDGFQFWSRRYTGTRGQLLHLVTTAAAEVAVALTAGPPRRSARSLSDPVALDLYLQARRAYHGFWRDAVERSVQLFDAALDRAPDDPLVLAGAALARARRVALALGDAAEPERVRAMAERALQISPALAEARVAMATLEMNLGDPVLAAREVRRALDDGPAQADAHQLAGRLLLETGPLTEAIHELEAAMRFEPGLAASRSDVARGLALAGRWDEVWERLATPEADSALRNVYEITRARLALWSGNRLIAQEILDTVSGGTFTMVPIVLQYAGLALTGTIAPEALTDLEGLTRLPSAPPRLTSYFQQVRTEVLVATGHLDAAESALAAAVQSSLFDLMWMERCPLLAPLRGRPGWGPLHATVARRALEIQAALRT